VQIDWSGRLDDRLILTRIDVKPVSVRVTGGSRLLENASTIYTEKVPLENIKQSGAMTVKLALQPASLKLAPGAKDRVTMEFEVRERNRAESIPDSVN
jgi:YbbR domain-containing protein